MPRPRFQRLSKAKRERIMEAAAREFAAQGYFDASLNRILQEASISKGAAYYYFDDKADLFATTVAHYASDMLEAPAPDPEQLSADTFWPTLQVSYERQLEVFADRPWAFGAIKAGARLTAMEIESQPSLRQLIGQIERRLRAIIQAGQQLAVIREDLPLDFLMSVFIAVDDALDRWLLENWQTLPAAARQETVARTLQGLARFMAPANEEKET